jgi:sugar-specific transcriptional regulator TrmB
MVTVLEESVKGRIVSRLKELGLSTNEAVAYIALLARPRLTASALCKETGVPDSKIYYTLDSLSKKGMIIIQQGTPNVYVALHPKEAIANLKQRLADAFKEKINQADALVDTLAPIFEAAESPQVLELAYIIRGQKNILHRMKNLMESARREITILIQHPTIAKEVKKALEKAKMRRVKLNIAVAKDILETGALAEFGNLRLLQCPGSILIVDMKNLLTISDDAAETAIMTQDQNLMRACRDYYDNPKCCTKITKTANEP